ncbi:MAG: Mpo1-like protein, partial [Candidatus Acidiferrales bacterium]
WILLFAGHRIEGNKPAFFQGVIYFLVGPIWVAKEIVDSCAAPLRLLLRRTRPRSDSRMN